MTQETPHNLGEAFERLRGKWAAFVCFGVLLAAMGVTSLVFAFATTLAMATINGVFFVIAGVAEIGVGAHARQWNRFFFWVLGGALYVFVGALCVLYPGRAAVVMTLALGAGLIAAGVVRAVLAAQLPAGFRRFMLALAALVTSALGLIVVTHWPLDSLYVLGALLGVDLVFHGAGWVVFGLSLGARARPAG